MRLILICLAVGLAALLASFLAATHVFEGIYFVPFMSMWFAILSDLLGAAATVLLVVAIARIAFRAIDADYRADEQGNARIAQVARRQIEAD
jgi:hypothetical protein